jgi:hypothetical protein
MRRDVQRRTRGSASLLAPAERGNCLASVGRIRWDTLDTLMVHKSFGLWGTVAGGLENELTVDHSGNAVVETLTLSLDAREPHGSEADISE